MRHVHFLSGRRIVIAASLWTIIVGFGFGNYGVGEEGGGQYKPNGEFFHTCAMKDNSRIIRKDIKNFLIGGKFFKKEFKKPPYLAMQGFF